MLTCCLAFDLCYAVIKPLAECVESLTITFLHYISHNKEQSCYWLKKSFAHFDWFINASDIANTVIALVRCYNNKYW